MKGEEHHDDDLHKRLRLNLVQLSHRNART